MMPTAPPPARPVSPFERPIGPLGAVGWSLAFFVALWTGRLLLQGIRPGSWFDEVSYALLYSAAALGVVYMLSRSRAPTAALARIVSAEPVGFVSAVLACVMGAAAAIPLDALATLIAKRWPIPPDAASEYAHALAGIGRGERIAGVIARVAALPLAQELLFRGALATAVLPIMERRGTLLVTAACFTLVSSPDQSHFWPYYFLVGLMLGHARMSTGSVLAAIGAQLAFNGVEVAVDLRAFGTLDPLITDAKLPPLPGMPTLVASSLVAIACAAGLARLARPTSEDPEVADDYEEQDRGGSGSDDEDSDDE